MGLFIHSGSNFRYMSLFYSISGYQNDFDLNSRQLYSSCVETNLRQVFVDFDFAFQLDKQCKHQWRNSWETPPSADFNSDITIPYRAILSISRCSLHFSHLIDIQGTILCFLPVPQGHDFPLSERPHLRRSQNSTSSDSRTDNALIQQQKHSR